MISKLGSMYYAGSLLNSYFTRQLKTLYTHVIGAGSVVCCRLYCYECAAEITMATNE